jgi:hypothetical protein
MEARVTQDAAGTHLDWSHDGVTPRMIDWFWSNLEKCFLLAHCIVAGLGLGPESLAVEQPLGYRLHQWEKSDFGVVGRSSAVGARKPESPEEGLVWARHCEQEVGNWGVFLPTLYRLYRVVENPAYNPFADLTVEGWGDSLAYKYIAGRVSSNGGARRRRGPSRRAARGSRRRRSG